MNQATVQQFLDLQSFQKIVAPFPGVITVRNVDPGALVTADNPSETRELFHLMQTDPLRVFVNVPQVYATTIVARPGGRRLPAGGPAEAVPGQGDAHGQRTGPQHAHPADRGRCSQPE